MKLVVGEIYEKGYIPPLPKDYPFRLQRKILRLTTKYVYYEEIGLTNGEIDRRFSDQQCTRKVFWKWVKGG